MIFNEKTWITEQGGGRGGGGEEEEEGGLIFKWGCETLSAHYSESISCLFNTWWLDAAPSHSLRKVPFSAVLSRYIQLCCPTHNFADTIQQGDKKVIAFNPILIWTFLSWLLGSFIDYDCK